MFVYKFPFGGRQLILYIYGYASALFILKALLSDNVFLIIVVIFLLFL